MKRRILAAGGLALTLGLTAACSSNEPPVLSPAPVPSLTEPTPTASVSIYPPGQDSPGAGRPADQSGAPTSPGAAFPNEAVKSTEWLRRRIFR